MTSEPPRAVEGALWMLAPRAQAHAAGSACRAAPARTCVSDPASPRSLTGRRLVVRDRAPTDLRRKRPASMPRGAALVTRYGSWARACRHAHRLAENPWAPVLTGPGRLPTRRYAKQDAIAALVACARDLDRRPSPKAYDCWNAAKKKGGHSTSVLYPCSMTILPAVQESGRLGAALEDAGLHKPPATTVRIVARDKFAAVQLAAAARTACFIAVEARNRNWLEIPATLHEVRGSLRQDECASRSVVTIWEPATGTLEEGSLVR